MKARVTDLFRQFAQDAAKLNGERQKARQLHADGNIDAAGNVVERAAFEWMRSRLPQRYGLAKGHVVDAKMNVSSEFDIIIFDNLFSSSIFSNEHIQYIPIEMLYGVGEVKTTFSYAETAGKNGNHVEAFQEKLYVLKYGLQRNILGEDKAAIDDLIFGYNSAVTPRNPIFSFMMYFDVPEESSQEHMARALQKIKSLEINNDDDWYNCIPGVICLLPIGILTKAVVECGDNYATLRHIYTIREWEKYYLKENCQPKWTLSLVDVAERRHARETAVLGYFYATLLSTLKMCRVEIPNWDEYITKNVHHSFVW